MRYEVDQRWKGMPMFDGHSDIWCDVSSRRRQGSVTIFNKHHRDNFIKGNIFGAIFVLWVNTEVPGDPALKFDELLEDIRAELAEQEGDDHDDDCGSRSNSGMTIIKSAQEYYAAMKNYINMRSGNSPEKSKIAVLLGLEGLDGINGRPEMMPVLYDMGFRHLSLTWNLANAYATGVQGPVDRGLTDAGRELLKFVERHPMLLDVSHANDKTFWDIVDVWNKPLIASHSNAKTLCDVPRNLTDEQIRAIAASGGLVGLNGYSLFVSHDPARMTVERLAEHAAHMADLVGTAHIGLGFDFVEYLSAHPSINDTALNRDPGGILPNCAQGEQMLKALQNKGFSEKEIIQIAHGNFGRLFEQL